MSETIKQAVARCRGNVFVLLDRDYSSDADALRLKVSKPEARKLVIDKASPREQPKAVWDGDDLTLIPGGWAILPTT